MRFVFPQLDLHKHRDGYLVPGCILVCIQDRFDLESAASLGGSDQAYHSFIVQQRSALPIQGLFPVLLRQRFPTTDAGVWRHLPAFKNPPTLERRNIVRQRSSRLSRKDLAQRRRSMQYPIFRIEVFSSLEDDCRLGYAQALGRPYP